MLHKVEVHGEWGGWGGAACGQKPIRAPQGVSQTQGRFICAAQSPLPVEIRQHDRCYAATAFMCVDVSDPERAALCKH